MLDNQKSDGGGGGQMQKCFKIQMLITGFSAIKKRREEEKKKKKKRKEEGRRKKNKFTSRASTFVQLQFMRGTF